MKMQVQSLASLYGLRIQRGCKLQHESQMGLRSHIAVAVVQAGSCSSNSTPGLGTSIWHGRKKKGQSGKVVEYERKGARHTPSLRKQE